MGDAFAHFFPDPVQRTQSEARWSATVTMSKERGQSDTEGEFLIHCAEWGPRWCKVRMDMNPHMPGFYMTLLQDVHQYKSHALHLDVQANTESPHACAMP